MRSFSLGRFAFPLEKTWYSLENFSAFIHLKLIYLHAHENLKRRILKSIIAWSEMGQQTAQSEKVCSPYCRTKWSFWVLFQRLVKSRIICHWRLASLLRRVHTTLEKFESATNHRHFGFVPLEENSNREISRLPLSHRLRKAPWPFSECFPSTKTNWKAGVLKFPRFEECFRRARFRGGLMWTIKAVGLTQGIKLRFQFLQRSVDGMTLCKNNAS